MLTLASGGFSSDSGNSIIMMYISVLIHTCMYMCVCALFYVCLQIWLYAYICRIYVRFCKYIHTYIYAHLRLFIFPYGCLHMKDLKNERLVMQTYMSIYIHTYVHTCITYVYVCIFIHICILVYKHLRIHICLFL